MLFVFIWIFFVALALCSVAVYVNVCSFWLQQANVIVFICIERAIMPPTAILLNVKHPFPLLISMGLE